jgi:hypothetical protein
MGEKTKRPVAFPPPAASVCEFSRLLQVGSEVHRSREFRDEGRAAPVGAEARRILHRDIGRRERRVLRAGEHVALRLGQVRVVVAQVEREHLIGDADAGVPVGIAGVLDAELERIARDRGAVEGVAGAKVPVADVGGGIHADAVAEPRGRRGQRDVAGVVDTPGAVI